MTPLEIELLLHYHTSPARHPRHDAPGVREARERFLALGLIEPDGRAGCDFFITTAKGRQLVRQLCSLDPARDFSSRQGAPDWTVDPASGRSNSSDEFEGLCRAVERLIRDSAHDLISGDAGTVARLIMAQLAHKHGLGPLETKRRGQGQGWS